MERQKQRGKEWTATFLVWWLNGPGEADQNTWAKETVRRFGGAFFMSGTKGGVDKQARKRVLSLVADLKALVNQAALLSKKPESKSELLAWRSFNQAIDAADAKLQRYRSRPIVISNDPFLKDGRWISAISGEGPLLWTTAPDSPSTPFQEFRAVEVVRDAVKHGWLDRLRLCAECGRWFFARKPWSKGCGAVCSGKLRKRHQTSEEYKQRRRKNPL